MNCYGGAPKESHSILTALRSIQQRSWPSAADASISATTISARLWAAATICTAAGLRSIPTTGPVLSTTTTVSKWTVSKSKSESAKRGGKSPKFLFQFSTPVTFDLHKRVLRNVTPFAFQMGNGLALGGGLLGGLILGGRFRMF